MRGVFVLVLWLAMGCHRGTMTPPESPPVPELVGPAPLRRLTNAQYLNALDDLFGRDRPTIQELPADPVVGGFDNAAEAQSPSDLRIARFAEAAQKLAQFVVTDPARLATVLGCPRWNTAELQTACLESFLATTARRVQRRALTDEELDHARTRFAQWQEQVDFEGAVQLSLEAMLQSPQFLYRPESQADFGGWALASRLSLLLWDSVPDAALLDAAERGELSTVEQVRAQAERLMADPKAGRVMWNFHRQWLALERLLLDEHLARTPEVDAQWTAATRASALEETRRFIEHTMLEEGTVSALLTSRRAWLDAETARLYDVPAPSTPWSPVLLDAEHRAGVLTRVAFLAGTSHRSATSPPIRGNSINLKLLCHQPTPPPPGVNATPPTPGPTATNRMVFEQRTSPSGCAGCHRTLNGLGFGFEHYTAAGRWQNVDQGLPVDATGELVGTDVDGPFDGAVQLSATLATSREVHHCATQMWVRYALGRAPVDGEQPWVEALANRFVDGGGDVKALLLDLVTSATFRSFPEDTP